MLQILFYSPLKKALKDARISAGLRQSDIADRAGLSIPTVRSLERGQGTLESLDRFLACLEIGIYGDRLPRTGDHLGQRLNALRRVQGVSRKALAEKIGVSARTIAYLEKDYRGRVETLDQILEALDAGAYLAPKSEATEPVALDQPEYRSASGVMDTLDAVVGRFDLAPCPSEISGRELTVNAKRHLRAEDDPLHLAWKGKVFVNPPFNDELPAWVEKAYEAHRSGKASLVAAYLPVFSNRPWWHHFVVNKALIVCLRGVVTFENGQANELPESLVIWGADDELQAKIEEAYPESWVIPSMF